MGSDGYVNRYVASLRSVFYPSWHDSFHSIDSTKTDPFFFILCVRGVIASYFATLACSPSSVHSFGCYHPTQRKYPEASDFSICSLIGGFFFLRFINPAIVTPQAYMLIDSLPTTAKHPRRTLTLVRCTVRVLLLYFILPCAL